jgi:hypothetical protein
VFGYRSPTSFLRLETYLTILARFVEFKDVLVNQIPAGYMGVPVKVIDGEEIKCRMVAGSVGIRCTSSGKPVDVGSHGRITSATEEVVGLDSVQPTELPIDNCIDL